MFNIDATTPQLKATKKWIDTICSLDISKATDLPEVDEQAKEAHIQWLGELMASLTKFELTTHEVIEAPGKVVIHVNARITVIDGITYDYDAVGIISLVEEDGEIKILEFKEFCDPHKRIAFYTGIAKAVTQRVPGS